MPTRPYGPTHDPRRRPASSPAGLVRAPAPLREHPLLALQRQIGNQAVQRLIQRSEADFWEGQPGENQGPPMPLETGGYADVNNPSHSYFFESDVEAMDARQKFEADAYQGEPGENQGPPMPLEGGGYADVNNPNHSYFFESDVEAMEAGQQNSPAEQWEG